MENQKRAGFTLGQLLAALAIINVVAFFLFLFLTVLQKANSLARRSYCTGNLKQVSVAMLQYAADYDDLFPPSATANNHNGYALTGWAATHDHNGGAALSHSAVTNGSSPTTIVPFEQLIGGYLKTVGILQCPEALKSSSPVSYMVNDLAAGKARGDFAAVANSVLVCDGESFAGNVGHAYEPSQRPKPPRYSRDGTVTIGATVQFAPTRHSGRAVYCFADGHVRLSKPETIYFPPRRFSSPSYIDKQTGETIGPDPAKLAAQGFIGTFHVR